MIVNTDDGEVRLCHLCIDEGGNFDNERTGRKFGKKYGEDNS